MSTSRIPPRYVSSTMRPEQTAGVKRSTDIDEPVSRALDPRSSPSAGEEAPHRPASPRDVQATRRRAMSSPTSQQVESRTRDAISEATASPATSTPEDATRALTERVRGVVGRITAEETAEGPWTSPDGMCLDLAAKWQQRLSQEGLPARIATVDPARREAGAPVTKGMEGKFHAYAVVEVPGAEPVVVDGSWRQFVQGAEQKPEMAGIFVGTTEDLVRELAPHRASLQVEIHDDPLLGRRDPRQTVELAYGVGPHAHLREVLEP